MHSSGILPEFLTCFDKKICKEHRLRITLENITTLSFPNICIISSFKAYFDYITKPFVTINNISITGPCYCPCSAS